MREADPPARPRNADLTAVQVAGEHEVRPSRAQPRERSGKWQSRMRRSAVEVEVLAGS